MSKSFNQQIDELAEQKLETFANDEDICMHIDGALSHYIESQKAGFSFLLDMIEEASHSQSASTVALSAELIRLTGDHLEKVALASNDKRDTVIALKFKELSNRLISPLFGTRLERARENNNIGVFTVGLKIFGSSANEAFSSVSEWMGVSISKVEAYYRGFYAYDRWLSEDKCIPFENDESRKASFVETYKGNLASILEKCKDREFPERNKKSIKHNTYKAFCEIKERLGAQV